MEESESGCLSILLIILYIASWLGAGMLAWNFIEPDSFGGAILFIITWSILGSVAHGICYFVIIAIFKSVSE